MLYIFQLFHLTPPNQFLCVSLAGLSTGQKMARVLCVAVHFYAGPPQREKKAKQPASPERVCVCLTGRNNKYSSPRAHLNKYKNRIKKMVVEGGEGSLVGGWSQIP